MGKYYDALIGKTIKRITDFPNSPGIVIEFTDGTTVIMQSGAFGNFTMEINTEKL